MRVLCQCQREERPERDRRQVMLLLTPCLLFICESSSLVHRFVSAVHFPAAAQRDFSAVGLMKDDLILWCEGRELTLPRS